MGGLVAQAQQPAKSSAIDSAGESLGWITVSLWRAPRTAPVMRVRCGPFARHGRAPAVRANNTQVRVTGVNAEEDSLEHTQASYSQVTTLVCRALISTFMR